MLVRPSTPPGIHRGKKLGNLMYFKFLINNFYKSLNDRANIIYTHLLYNKIYSIIINLTILDFIHTSTLVTRKTNVHYNAVIFMSALFVTVNNEINFNI